MWVGQPYKCVNKQTNGKFLALSINRYSISYFHTFHSFNKLEKMKERQWGGLWLKMIWFEFSIKFHNSGITYTDGQWLSSVSSEIFTTYCPFNWHCQNILNLYMQSQYSITELLYQLNKKYGAWQKRECYYSCSRSH